MQISRHAHKRIYERGLDHKVLEIINEILPAKFRNQSCQVSLKKKDAISIAKCLRKIADKVEKHSGVVLIQDESGSTLITAYRKG